MFSLSVFQSLCFSVSVLARRHPVARFKLSVKIGKVFKSRVFRDRHDLVVAAAQSFRRGRQPSVVDIGNKTSSCHLLEPSHEMAVAPPAELSHIRHCKRFPLPPLRLLEHSFQTFHIRGKPLDIRRVLLYQQKDKLKHSRFNSKLKTVPSLSAEFFHSLKTVRRLPVSFFLRIEPHRGKKFSGGDRHQIFS